MKKSIFRKYLNLTSIIFLFSFNSYAQTNNFHHGLKGGIDFFNFPVEETNNRLETEYNTGYFIGIFGQFYLKDKLSLQSELIFRRHKAVENISDLVLETPTGIFVSISFPVEVKVSDYIIQLPLKIKYELLSNFEVGLGPQFSYIVDREFETTENTIDFDSATSENSEIISNIEYDKFDFGISLGINYNFNSNLGVFVDYTAGLIERDNKINTSIIDLGISWRIK